MYKLAFLFIILINAIDYRIAGLTYWDELLFLGVVIYTSFKHFRFSVLKSKLVIVINLSLLVSIGLLSNLSHPELQTQRIAILKDIVALVKFPLLAILLLRHRKPAKQRKIVQDAATISKIVLGIMLVTAALGYIFDIGVYLNEVRIVKCYKFFFSHPTFLVSSLVMMSAVLIADSIKKNKLALIIAAFLIFLSGRTKGYVVIVVLLFLLLFNHTKFRRIWLSSTGELLIKKRHLFICGILLCSIVYFLAKNKFLDYTHWGMTAARPALYMVGLFLIRDYFPLGSGFGTFASALSGEYYSGIYSKYQIDRVNGLIRGNTNYIADTFPPYIYGQFGIWGATIYVNILIQLIKEQLFRIKSYDRLIAFLYLWIYAIIASLAEAFFTNTSGVQLAVLLSVYIGIEKGINTSTGRLRNGYKKDSQVAGL